MMKAVIEENLIHAYAETHYCVEDEPPFTLMVGEASAPLLSCHKRHSVDCSAFITAWNPFSKQLTPAKNKERNHALIQEIKGSSLYFLPGVGKHPSNDWPGEQSILVLGLCLESAKTLGCRFEQNAVVWIGPEGIPELIDLNKVNQ
jgi:hypothetical protein